MAILKLGKGIQKMSLKTLIVLTREEVLKKATTMGVCQRDPEAN